MFIFIELNNFVPSFFMPARDHPAMLLLLVCLAFLYLIYPRLSADDIQVTVVGEALFGHQRYAAARPGGVAYLFVRRHAVDHRAAQRVRYHRQVIRMVIQPLALQVFIPGCPRAALSASPSACSPASGKILSHFLYLIFI